MKNLALLRIESLSPTKTKIELVQNAGHNFSAWKDKGVKALTRASNSNNFID